MLKMFLYFKYLLMLDSNLAFHRDVLNMIFLLKFSGRRSFKNTKDFEANPVM